MTIDRRRALTLAFLAAITAAAAFLRIAGLRFGLPHTMTRPDEETIASVATRILHSGGGSPEFFRYPTLFMYAVAFVERIRFGALGAPDAASAFLVGRALSAAAGIATVPLLFAAARVRLGDRVALVASALLAVAYLHVRNSHFGVTDAPATLMVVVAFFAAVALPLGWPRWWNLAIAGVACGLAASTKYNDVLIVAPLAVAAVQQNAGAGRTSLKPLALCAAAIALGVGAGFLIGTPYALLDRHHFVRDVMAESAHLAAGHAGISEIGWIHHLRVSLWYGIGPLLLAAAAAGAVRLWLVDRRAAWLVLAFPIVYYAALGAGRTTFSRYMMPIVPFIVLLAAVAIDGAAAAIARGGSNRRGLLTAIAIALTALVGVDNVTRDIRFDRLLRQTDSRVLAARWIESRYPEGARIYQSGSAYGHVQLPEGRFLAQSFDDNSGEFLLGNLPSIRPRLVVLQRSRLESYSVVPATLPPLLDRWYRPVQSFTTEDASVEVEPIFGQQDAFFVPLAGLERYQRPGPDLHIFELRQ